MFVHFPGNRETKVGEKTLFFLLYSISALLLAHRNVNHVFFFTIWIFNPCSLWPCKVNCRKVFFMLLFFVFINGTVSNVETSH